MGNKKVVARLFVFGCVDYIYYWDGWCTDHNTNNIILHPMIYLSMDEGSWYLSCVLDGFMCINCDRNVFQPPRRRRQTVLLHAPCHPCSFPSFSNLRLNGRSQKNANPTNVKSGRCITTHPPVELDTHRYHTLASLHLPA